MLSCQCLLELSFYYSSKWSFGVHSVPEIEFQGTSQNGVFAVHGYSFCPLPPPPKYLMMSVSKVLTPPARIRSLSNIPCCVKNSRAAMPNSKTSRGTRTDCQVEFSLNLVCI